ncbi:leucine carboxyl methyltransferase [Diaporthe amygdali]|uniref:leucine carboxyl methyltransferase n=1 Tax=Phomopsis amygdali TaxID=1214568 RepID=UPI0022FED78F|nr:leucine carboxyl methyltransferase [Diaporthe amygdali]KAJ0125523.1 leucine carboxyl methyltransferase [Diaporthe amygdali]
MGVRIDKGRSSATSLLLPKATAQDDLVMGTNNSSIVSKRSVERLYYPDEPHFFRFFVKKFQRRAPLINRGYHLRLHVIDVTLRNFLKQPSEKTKVIVNLGCGSDVVPWQCWTRYPEHCSQSQAVFVDVDFPDLALRKRQVILATPELESRLSGVQAEQDEAHPNMLLRSDRYHLVGCDLRQSMALQQVLNLIVDPKECIFLFLAEVSITYMETDSADSLIQWASSLGQAEFCLLEQIFPDGPGHPFARTMMDHFNKLSTPIKGWSSVRAQSLWSAWNDNYFLSMDDRQKLDEIEPFDEWEEFCLFASHYLILHAANYGKKGTSSCLPDTSSDIPSAESSTTYKPLTGQQGLRRFGAAMLASDAFGRASILNFMGLGHTTRVPSYDIYKLHGSGGDIKVNPEGPPSRMCHSLTNLGIHGTLLVGGRNSPSRAKNDCWLFKKDSHHWERIQDLPIPLYRHAVCSLSGSSVVLLIGGKSEATGVSSAVMVFNPDKGWQECEVHGSLIPTSVFGAMLTCSGREQENILIFHGFLIGGISDGIIQNQILAWDLLLHDHKAPSITFTLAETDDTSSALLARFGATCIQQEDSLIVLGGVGHMGVIPQRQEILMCTTTGSKIHVSTAVPLSDAENGQVIPRPLIVGSSVVCPRNGQIVILGGGATCFSMGSFCWEFSGYGEFASPPSNPPGSELDKPAEVRPIPRVNAASRESFEDIVRQGTPVVIEGLDLGACRSKWTLDYLAKQVGSRKVVVHECDVQTMDFKAKNFRYTSMTFGEFARGIQNGARLYLRALSADAPSDRPANLAHDFPSLAADFRLPEALSMCSDNLHSSILRVSGQLDMWLHYDVQANVYCQISGSKRMLLFPPSDVVGMSFAPGSSSSSVDVFSCLNSPTLRGTHPWEANLNEGDVLFLPPLWLHTATPTSNVSIAVNVFFRNLDRGYSIGRDVYGNRDLAAYEKGRQEIARISKSFDTVPVDARQFYMLRLAEELAEAARSDK